MQQEEGGPSLSVKEQMHLPANQCMGCLGLAPPHSCLGKSLKRLMQALSSCLVAKLSSLVRPNPPRSLQLVLQQPAIIAPYTPRGLGSLWHSCEPLSFLSPGKEALAGERGVGGWLSCSFSNSGVARTLGRHFQLVVSPQRFLYCCAAISACLGMWIEFVLLRRPNEMRDTDSVGIRAACKSCLLAQVLEVSSPGEWTVACLSVGEGVCGFSPWQESTLPGAFKLHMPHWG